MMPVEYLGVLSAGPVAAYIHVREGQIPVNQQPDDSFQGSVIIQDMS